MKDLLPHWVPIDIDVDEIVESIDFLKVGGDDVAGAGITFNTNRSGFLLQLPLIIAELGQLRINCYTDYEKFNCELKATAAGLVTYLTAGFEIAKDITLLVLRETDELFQEVGPIVAAAIEGVAGDAKAFAKETLGKTAELINKGLEDVGDEAELMAAAAIQHMILNPYTDVKDHIEKGVKEVSEWGKDMYEDAEKLYKDAEHHFVSLANSLEGELNCDHDSIVSGVPGACDTFDDIVDKLEKFGNDVGAVLKKMWEETCDFIEDVGDLFYNEQTKYKYKRTDPLRYCSKTGCPLDNVIKETKKKVIGFPVETKRKYM